MLPFNSLKRVEAALEKNNRAKRMALEIIAQCERENREYMAGRGMHGEKQDILTRAREINTRRIHDAQVRLSTAEQNITLLQRKHDSLTRDARAKEVKKRLAQRRRRKQ